MKRLASALAIVALAGCGGGGGGSSTATPSVAPAQIAGRYVGPIQDKSAGAGTFLVTLVQSGSSLSGSWATYFASSTENNSGSLSGSVSGSNVSLALNSADSNSCNFQFSGGVSGSQISGTYQTAQCSVDDSGSIVSALESGATSLPNISGTYVGTLPDDNITVPITVTLTQRTADGSLLGTYSIGSPGSATSGTATGIVENGQTAQIYLSSSVAFSTRYAFTLTIGSGTLSGSDNGAAFSLTQQG